MGKIFLKVKLENFERVREEKIVYGVENLRKTVVCGNLFSIVNYEPAGGTPNRKIFELRIYDGNEITTLNSTKEGFEEMFESVDFEGIKIPLVSFDNELYEMIQDNQDRYFDIDSAEILINHGLGEEITNFITMFADNYYSFSSYVKQVFETDLNSIVFEDESMNEFLTKVKVILKIS